MISKELREIFAKSINYAKTNRHEYLTLEHIFLMLINNSTIENMFFDLGVDTKILFDDLKTYIEANTPKLPDDIKDDPIDRKSTRLNSSH